MGPRAHFPSRRDALTTSLACGCSRPSAVEEYVKKNAVLAK